LKKLVSSVETEHIIAIGVDLEEETRHKPAEWDEPRRLCQSESGV